MDAESEEKLMELYITYGNREFNFLSRDDNKLLCILWRGKYLRYPLNQQQSQTALELTPKAIKYIKEKQ